MAQHEHLNGVLMCKPLISHHLLSQNEYLLHRGFGHLHGLCHDVVMIVICHAASSDVTATKDSVAVCAAGANPEPRHPQPPGLCAL